MTLVVANASQSLTQLCQTAASAKAVLEALHTDKKPDGRTLECALERLREANQRCGSYGPASEHVDDVASGAFYGWLTVVEELIEQHAPATVKARSIAFTIGHGLNQKLECRESSRTKAIAKINSLCHRTVKAVVHKTLSQFKVILRIGT